MGWLIVKNKAVIVHVVIFLHTVLIVAGYTIAYESFDNGANTGPVENRSYFSCIDSRLSECPTL